MKPIFAFSTLLVTASTLCVNALAAPVVISGTARNGSEKNAPLANATVELVRPIEGGKNIPIAKTQSDAKGKFTFPTQNLNDKDLLMVKIDRGGFDYWTVAYDGGNKLKSVGVQADPKKSDLLVFDTTRQGIPLKFQVHHLAIKATEKGIHCIERIVITNPTKQTLLGIGKNNVSVWLNVPAGAKNVKLDPKMEGKLVKTSSGYGYAHPVTPEAYGVRNALIFSYDMEWPSNLPWARKVDVSRDTVYETDFFFVARETGDKDLEVKAPLLGVEAEQQLPIEGKLETRIVNAVGSPSMPNMPAGTEAPAPALPASKKLEITIGRPVNPLFWGFAGLTIALCLFLPLALIKPKNSKKITGKSEPEGTQFVSHQSSLSSGISGGASLLSNGLVSQINMSEQSQKLIRQIADLDDQREAGQISEEEYQTQRTALKTQLIDSLSAPSSKG
jgi:hypothetical protein